MAIVALFSESFEVSAQSCHKNTMDEIM